MQKIIIALLLFISLDAKGDYWTQKADFGGSVRFGAFSFSIGNLGYIGGGYANGTDYGDLWQYNPAINSWTQKNNLPIVVRAAGNFVINGKGYVTCGRNSVTINSLYEYDPVSNTWTTKANFPGVAIYGGAGFAIGNKGYYGIGNGGGANGPYYTAFYEYDPLFDSWTQKAAFPAISRYGTYGISLNGKGYAGFGGNEALSLAFNDWWEYDPLNDTWIARANYPGLARSYPAGFSINNKIYVGTGAAIGPAYFNDDFYEFDPMFNLWTQKQNYGGGIPWVATGFAIADTGYFGTGFDSINYLRNFWAYIPDSTTGTPEFPATSFNLQLSPNPCKEFTILSFGLPVQKNTRLTISNVLGKTVYTKQLSPQTSHLRLPTANLAKGIYTLRVDDREHSAVKKFVKE